MIIKLFDYISLKLSTVGYRFSLISECLRLSKKKRLFPDKYKAEIIKDPNRFHDFINFLCFLNNNKIINQYSSSFANQFKPSEKMNLELDLLDNCCKNFSQYKNFIIKIDAQGHELEIIEGGLITISRASIVLLECSFAKQYKNKEHTFSRCAYLLNKIDFHPIIFQPRHAGNILSMHAIERNVIFVKKNFLQKVYYENY
jgi:hypothetical protein